MLSLTLAALLLQTSAAAARNPSYARDGRLAVSVQGDLWVVSARGEWTRLTSGAAWDREPAWAPDGSSIVFSSDRAGNFDLWRITVAGNGAVGEPEQITSSPLPEGQPAIARICRSSARFRSVMSDVTPLKETRRPCSSKLAAAVPVHQRISPFGRNTRNSV